MVRGKIQVWLGGGANGRLGLRRTEAEHRRREESSRVSMHIIGGRAYWAGQAAARPLFSPCGQGLFFARPLFVVENLHFVVMQQCRGL